MCNGRGLSYASQDILAVHGGLHANFLDLAGDSSSDDFDEAIALLQWDNRVKCIFVNIFGGVFQNTAFMRGIIDNVKKNRLTKPIVIRMRGDDEASAKKLLDQYVETLDNDSKIRDQIHFELDFNKAAKLAVEITNSR